MIKISQAVIVEGRYDKIKLSSFLDALIITTDGFSVFKDKQKRELIRLLAEKRGIVLLTDSDSAGFLIRNHLADCVKSGKVYHAIIPEIQGKERRKTAPGRENLLGVEGMSEQVLTQALRKAGVFEAADCEPSREVTKMDLYNDCFSGAPDSKRRREEMMKALGIPSHVSVNSLPMVITMLCGYNKYREYVNGVDEICKKA